MIEPTFGMTTRFDRQGARRLLALALAVGVVAEVVLDGSAIGINVSIATLAVLAAAWVVRRRGRALDPVDTWLPATAIVLSLLAAIRADPFVAFLDLAGAAAFTGASVAALSGLAVTRRSIGIVIAIGAWVVESTLAGTARLLVVARPARRDAPRERPVWLGGVVRGLILAVPLVVILATLFASADPIFRRTLDEAFGVRIDLGDLPGRAVFVLAAAWLVGGLLAVAASGIPAIERASLGAAAGSRPLALGRALGTVEALVVLLAVDLVVGLFVGLQVAYLFGGLDTLAAAGLSYSDYARRGYFELVGAAGIAGAIIVALETQVAGRSRAYRLLALVLVALTIVVLASAALRLQLYQDAYGWTELRLYVAVSIAAMAATLVTLAAFVATDRTRWIGHALAVIGVVSLVGLNLLAPAAFVAERNVARIIDPSLVPADGQASLDAGYLAVLPDDAIPTLVAALQRLPESEARLVEQLLLRRRAELRNDPSVHGPFAWNLGRERARAALETLP